MMPLRITTPSRLHFGLLAYGPHAPRQFGGVGLAIERPGIALSAANAGEWLAEGPLAERALRIARQVADRLKESGAKVSPLSLRIDRAPAEHLGLGTGTQLSLAVTRVLAVLAGLGELPVERLAKLSGRGQRSGIGLHGFERGGFLVDGGRRGSGDVPPLLARLEFPSDWSILIVIPGEAPGLHGPNEVKAFAQLPAIPDAVTDHLCRLVMLGLMPAVVDADLQTFGAALSELQARVGECFAAAQGGNYAMPASEAIVASLRAAGLHGVGQSSWGPALYAFSREDEERKNQVLRRIADHFQLAPGSIFWTRANCHGSVLTSADA